MNLLRKQIQDKRVTELIKKYLESGVMERMGYTAKPRKALRKEATYLHCLRIFI